MSHQPRQTSTRDWLRHGQLTIVYRSYGSQTWSIKWSAISSKQRLCRYCYMDAPHGHWLNGWRKSLTAITQECCEQYWTSPGDITPQSSSYTTTDHPITKTIQVRRTRVVGHCWRSRDELVSDVLLWTPSYGRAKAGRPAWTTYSSSVPIRDVALRICRKQWTIERCSERGSGIAVLITRHDDDDDDDVFIYVEKDKNGRTIYF